MAKKKPDAKAVEPPKLLEGVEYSGPATIEVDKSLTSQANKLAWAMFAKGVELTDQQQAYPIINKVLALREPEAIVNADKQKDWGKKLAAGIKKKFGDQPDPMQSFLDAAQKLSGKLSDKNPLKAYQNPPSTLDVFTLWDQFTRKYTQDGADKGAVKAINLLNRLAFGDGAEAIASQYDTTHINAELARVQEKLAEANSRILGEKLLETRTRLLEAKAKAEKGYKQVCDDVLGVDDVGGVAPALSELAQDAKTRPLNRLVTLKLLEQFVEQEKRHDLYPPPEISPGKGVGADERERVYTQRDVLIGTKPGGLLYWTIQKMVKNTIDAQSRAVHKGLPESIQER